MCGITGISRIHGEVESHQLERATAALAHRGPDDRGTFVDGTFGMGHTRLSIIDLAGGHQPLYADNGRLALIANGEIYNHIELRRELEALGQHFATHSDSEVILHAYLAWGDTFVEHLNGMFAFALYDKAARRLTLARDRLGIKPLFLAHLPEGVAFASEIKGLLPYFEHSPTIDPDGLVQYLNNQFSSGRTTLLEGVERVSPAEIVTVEHGRITRRRHYWAPEQAPRGGLDFATASAEFDSLVETVMREHMRSDVPYGLFLSGGVDSSVLLALLSRYRTEPVRTFSVGFEGTTDNELPLARKIAARFGSGHTEIRPAPTDILHSLPYVAWAADDLMRDNANLPTALLAQAAAADLKVVFAGEGGDEVFAGYGRYRPSWLERQGKRLLAPGSGGFRARGTLRGPWPRRLLPAPLRARLAHVRQPFIDAWRAAPSDWTDLQRRQYTDLTTALPDNLLVKLDRMLMGVGLEGRVPFLDHRVVEFGLSLPDQLKIEASQGKAFLKRWADPLLPREVLYAKKRGFHVPMGEFFRDDFKRRLGEVLPQHPAIREHFRDEGVRRLVAEYGRSGVVNRLTWALLQFAVWHELLFNGLTPERRQDPLALIR